MSACCCALAGTRACDTCPQGPSRLGAYYPTFPPKPVICVKRDGEYQWIEFDDTSAHISRPNTTE